MQYESSLELRQDKPQLKPLISIYSLTDEKY